MSKRKPSKSKPAKSKPARLRRSERIFEFIVDYPHGTRAVAGYRKAARHFGWRTREDPSFDGLDQCRLLIDRDPKALRRVAQRLLNYVPDETDDEDDYLSAELDILLEANVAWITQDWKYWDIDSDDGAMEHIGWSRTIAPHGKHGFRVTLRLRGGARR
jgi:hypothetical protein